MTKGLLREMSGTVILTIVVITFLTICSRNTVGECLHCTLQLVVPLYCAAVKTTVYLAKQHSCLVRLMVLLTDFSEG